MNQGIGHQKKKQIVIVAMTGNMLLDFAGPTDVFFNANKCLRDGGLPDGYDVLVVAAVADKKVDTQTGMSIVCQHAAMDIKTPIDTLIVAGNDFREASEPALIGFYNWLSARDQHNTRRIASVCGG